MNFKQFSWMLLLASVSFLCACSGKSSGEVPTTLSEVGKWTIQDSQSTYESFEFLPGHSYIAVMRKGASVENSAGTSSTPTRSTSDERVVTTGKYTLVRAADGVFVLRLEGVGEVTITLSGFGKKASVAVKGATYTAEKAAEVQVTDKTALLCHTWKMDSAVILTYRNDSLIDTFIDKPGAYAKEKVLDSHTTMNFTTANTWLLTYEVKDSLGVTKDYDMGSWKWMDDERIQVLEEDVDKKHIQRILKLTDRNLVMEGILEEQIDASYGFKDKRVSTAYLSR